MGTLNSAEWIEAIKKILRALPLVAMAILVAAPNSSHAYSCNFLEKSPRPSWAPNGKDIPGFYVGVGQAGKRDKKEEQIEASRQNSFKNLASAISVQIKGTMRDEITFASKGAKQKMEQNIEMVTESEIMQSLRGVQVRETWLDRKSCILWTLSAVSIESVEYVKTESIMKSRFSAMRSLYEQSTDQRDGANRKKQLEQLKDAEYMLEKVDFKYLPKENGKSWWAKKIRNAMAPLKSRLKQSRFKTVIAPILIGEDFSQIIVERLAAHVKSAFGDADVLLNSCASEKDCLRFARGNGFNRLSLMKVEKRVEQGNLGAFKGTLRVEVTIYEAETGSIVKNPVSTFAQTVGWTEDGIKWNLAADKIIKSGKLSNLE